MTPGKPLEQSCRKNAREGAHPARRFAVGAALVALVLATILGMAAAKPAPAAAHIVPRGIVDETLLGADPVQREAILTELADELHCQYTRVTINWSFAEPAKGVYADASYLNYIKQTIAAATAHGLKVIVMVYYTPEWASDRSLWSSPPKGYDAGRYLWCYPMRPEALPDWQALAQHLATSFAGLVSAYECWCEPNLWGYFWPQRTASDSSFSVHFYAQMLQSFYQGVKAGDPNALVVGGNTSPFGANNQYGTSPLTFAQKLAKTSAVRYIDVYAHHPYSSGPKKVMPRPAAKPSKPKFNITLGNIQSLLKVFPKKPFYLDEFGYGTAPSNQFHGGQVTPATQARYLKQAYTLVNKYPQVKALLWELRQDYSSTGDESDPWGLYMGLDDLQGQHKPAWYTFAALPLPR
jgi:hypothetical protein